MGAKATVAATALPPTAGAANPRKPRLAIQIARRLEDQILEESWPVGFQIGREAELATDMGVSRWTLREAVRILEASGFVATRKGAHGGLFVASSAYDFVCKMASNYLEFVQVSEEEFSEVLRALNRLSIAEAIERISAEDGRRMQAELASIVDKSLAEQLEAAGPIREFLVRSSSNPALELFIGALGKVIFDACIYSTLDDGEWLSSFRAVVAAIHDMGQAVIARDPARALQASDEFAAIFCRLFAASFLHQRIPITPAATQRAYDFFPPARPLKKVDGVERAIREMIFDEGWPVGSSLGSEKELATRFGVGRWVLRDALRSLEQLGVIEMGRGTRSGVRVVSPDPWAVADACRRFLRREMLIPEQAAAVRTLLKPVAQNCDPPLPISDLFEQILAE